MKITYKNILAIVAVSSVLMSGCKKLVDAGAPTGSINSENVYSKDETATSVLTAQYSSLSIGTLASGESLYSFLSLYPGLAADELSAAGTASGQAQSFYQGLYTATDPGVYVWGYAYGKLYGINAALEGLNGSASISPAIKQQLLGEAYFLRAFYLFYLTNLYGDLPLTISTDHKVNFLLARSSSDQVYEQIIQDLVAAKSMLSPNFVALNLTSTTTERVRPNKWAATALLARAYLYNKQYAEAEAQASEVIAQNSLFSLPGLNEVFVKNSKEAIWQLQPVNSGWNTEDARFFVIPETGFDGGHFTYVSESLLNSFETNDQRKQTWLGVFQDNSGTPAASYYYPFKYKISVQGADVEEYHTVLRLAEQYLIRAEARAMQGKGSEAGADLTVIRKRAGLDDYTGATDQTSLVNAVLKERRVELFSELGQRWFDLKRLGKINEVMTAEAPKKDETWRAELALLPISKSDLEKSPNLVQNKGY